ncbi:RDD family protein [Archangium sp.]|uniref:RDD family protein n=1 Tax=Archangium sp. TaxID=1872627 RepID=UPI00389A8AC3
MYQTDPNPTRSGGAFCADHVERAAVTICNRCGGYACDACLRVGLDRLDYCFHCVPLTQQLAEPGTRFLAVLMDLFAPLVPLFIGAVLGGLLEKTVGAAAGTVFAMLGVLGVLGVFGYQLYLLATTGQSLGKRTLGIKVVRADGSPVDLGRLIFLRNIVPAVIGMVTCNLFSLADPLFIFSNDHRCLHDHLADTKVIKVDPPRR